MARFASTQASEGSAIGTLADAIVGYSARVYTALTSASPTLTAAQAVGGIVNVSGQTAAQDVTFPSAATVVAAVPNAQVGSSFELVLQNANTSTGAVTIVAGSGNTLVGTVNVPITKTQIYRAIITSVRAGAEAVSYYGLLTAPV